MIMVDYPPQDVLERVRSLLVTHGREPYEWPVPIRRSDLEAILRAANIPLDDRAKGSWLWWHDGVPL
jgi:hypothetical protein